MSRDREQRFKCVNCKIRFWRPAYSSATLCADCESKKSISVPEPTPFTPSVSPQICQNCDKKFSSDTIQTYRFCFECQVAYMNGATVCYQCKKLYATRGYPSPALCSSCWSVIISAPVIKPRPEREPIVSSIRECLDRIDEVVRASGYELISTHHGNRAIVVKAEPDKTPTVLQLCIGLKPAGISKKAQTKRRIRISG